MSGSGFDAEFQVFSRTDNNLSLFLGANTFYFEKWQKILLSAPTSGSGSQNQLRPVLFQNRPKHQVDPT